MKARAPGKLVLSGAYAVLEGAPALVLAVDRYVVADAAREAVYLAEEVQAAVELGIMPAPIWYDVSALRTEDNNGGRKLGLGSSAAIISACIGACRLAAGEPPEGLAARVFPDALRAHRQAQPRGSGIDVATSCFGGVVACVLDPTAPDRPLRVTPHQLLAGLHIEVFASHISASTGGMLAAVQALRERHPQQVASLIAEAGQGAAAALAASHVPDFVAALRRQYQALGKLGAAAGVAIVGPEETQLDEHAARQGASFGPSGAGGGDVALYVGPAPSSARFRAEAQQAGLALLDLQVAVPGLGPCA